jgi:hypothetical protein
MAIAAVLIAALIAALAPPNGTIEVQTAAVLIAALIVALGAPKGTIEAQADAMATVAGPRRGGPSL